MTIKEPAIKQKFVLLQFNFGHAKLRGRVLRVRRVLRRTPGVSNSN